MQIVGKCGHSIDKDQTARPRLQLVRSEQKLRGLQAQDPDAQRAA